MTEVMAMLEIVKKAKNKAKKTSDEISAKSLKFWRAVEKKNLIPDRTAESLKTAYRRYECKNVLDFVKSALTSIY